MAISMKNLLPTARFCRIYSIPDSFLQQNGIKLVLADMDNTVAPWHSTKICEKTAEWVKNAKQSGISVVLFTNSKGAHADLIGENLGIPVFKGAGKPFVKQAKSLIKSNKITPAQTLFVGDQLFTDILLANKLNAKSVLTEPLDSREWWCTKVFNRSREKLVWKFLFKN